MDFLHKLASRSDVNSSNDLQIVRPSQFWLKSVTGVLVSASAFGIAFLAIARTEEIVVAPGSLEPLGSVKDIRLPVGGIIQEILVKEGERVKKGQVLLRLDSEVSRKQLHNQSATLANKKRQLELKLLEEQQVLLKNSQDIQTAKNTLVLEKSILSRLANLNQSGAISELQYLQQKNKTFQAESNLQNLQVERKRLQTSSAQQIKQLNSEISEIDYQLTIASVNLKYQAVASPVDGMVFQLKPKAAGFSAQGTEPVLQIVPVNNLQAVINVPSSDIGFVRVGQPVEINLDSYPASDFGAISGEISKIGSDAKQSENSAPNAPLVFPVDVALSGQYLQTKAGNKLPLRPGMSLTAYVKLRSVSYLQLFLGGLRDRTAALRSI